MTHTSTFDNWLQQPIPTVPVSELALFTDPASIDAHNVGALDPSALLDSLKRQPGAKVLGIDLGGGSVRGEVFEVSPAGTLVQTTDCSGSTKAEGGAGFLEQLETFAAYAAAHDLPVGFSYGGPLDGTVPRYHPKIPQLMDALQAKYDGDFARMFTTPFVVINDASAALVRSVAEVMHAGATDPVVICLVNGGGLGGGVYMNGTLHAIEPGHVACVPELNQYGATKPCGLYGDYVCLENVISNKQGFEIQWRQRTGEALNGKEIEDRARDGDKFAMGLFEQAARTEATVLQGVANIFAVDVRGPRCHMIAHGGLHRTPNLLKRVAQILWETENPEQQILFTEGFDPNACMHGAALYALAFAASDAQIPV